MIFFNKIYDFIFWSEMKTEQLIVWDDIVYHFGFFLELMNRHLFVRLFVFLLIFGDLHYFVYLIINL